MKKLNKAQEKVLHLSQKLKPMNLSKMNAHQLFEGHIIRKQGKCYCSACGEYICDEKELKTIMEKPSYYLADEKIVSPNKCPHCHIKLTGITTSNTVWVANYAVAEQIAGWLVIRTAWYCSRQKAGKPQEIWTQGENQQYWIKNNKRVRLSQNLTFMAHRHYNPFSSWDHELKMRSDFFPNSSCYLLDQIEQITVVTRKFRKMLAPFLKDRNIIHYISKYNADPYFETLAEKGHFNIFKRLTISEMKKYKHAIRIALKHGCNIDNIECFLQRVKLLEYFHMDTHSPALLMNGNLEDRLRQRKYKIERKKERIDKERHEMERIREKLKAHSYYETLLKMYRQDLFDAIPENSMAKYQSSIRIALKNGNPIEDWSHFRDTLQMMEEFKMDLHSPKYLCNPNLHQKLLDKKDQILIRKEAKRREKTYLEIYNAGYNGMPIEKYYRQAKGKYLNWGIKTDKYNIFVMPTVRDIMEEGIHMHHCVFSMGYWHRDESLIIAVRSHSGKRIVTCEVDIKEMKVIQVQGACDRKPACRNEVTEILNAHMTEICHPRSRKQIKIA